MLCALQELIEKYIRALCDADPSVQLLFCIKDIMNKDAARLRPLLEIRLRGVGYDSILGESQAKVSSCWVRAKRAVRKFIMLPQFEITIQIAIVMSCISLAAENPNGPEVGHTHVRTLIQKPSDLLEAQLPFELCVRSLSPSHSPFTLEMFCSLRSSLLRCC